MYFSPLNVCARARVDMCVCLCVHNCPVSKGWVGSLDCTIIMIYCSALIVKLEYEYPEGSVLGGTQNKSVNRL